MIKDNITMFDANIGFRNFSGKEGRFNPAGRRNFCVFMETELGVALEKDGWNVRWLQPKDEGDSPKAYLQIAVSYDHFPPHIVLVSSHGKTTLDEETVSMLDWAEIKIVDFTMNPSNWNVNGKTGVKAYIKSMFVTIVEDELEEKYYDIPDTALKGIAAPAHNDEEYIDTDFADA